MILWRCFRGTHVEKPTLGPPSAVRAIWKVIFWLWIWENYPLGDFFFLIITIIMTGCRSSLFKAEGLSCWTKWVWESKQRTFKIELKRVQKPPSAPVVNHIVFCSDKAEMTDGPVINVARHSLNYDHNCFRRGFTTQEFWSYFWYM